MTIWPQQKVKNLDQTAPKEQSDQCSLLFVVKRSIRLLQTLVRQEKTYKILELK